MLLRSRPPCPCVTYKKAGWRFINFDPSFCLCTDLWLADVQAYLLLSTGPPVRTDESIITTCSRLRPSCLITLNPAISGQLGQSVRATPKHYRPFLDLSMAQLSIHAKSILQFVLIGFFDPMGGIKLCDLNRSHHFIKKTCWYGICLAQAQKHLNITLSPDHSGIKRNIQSMTFYVDETKYSLA